VQKVLDIVGALLYNRRRQARAFKNLAQLPQKVLDNSGPCAYTTRVGTGSSRDQRVELFWAIVQKVLDSIDPALYNRRGAFIRPKQFKKILSNRAKKT
jgi:hypothetical protein